jgi:transposase
VDHRCQGKPDRFFCNGHCKDQAAVGAGIATLWSNGQTEGQVNRLKVLKRQMYGRAKVDLLEARLIGVT